MTAQQLTAEVLSLPIAERVELAQALWESIECGLPAEIAPEVSVREAIKRDAELASGAVIGRTHEEVIATVRQSLK